MTEDKLVFPGDHISSYEEAEPGDNCYAENDEVYSASFGRPSTRDGKAEIERKGRRIERPVVGMEVYGIVIRCSPNKAIVGCIESKEAEQGVRGLSFDAVLPVTGVRRGYVADLRYEIKIGDIIKAKVNRITKTGVEISIFASPYGCVKVFCPKDRHEMDLKGGTFICSNCGWKERRKLPRSNNERGQEGL